MAVAPLPSVSSSPTPPIPPLSAGARILNTFIAPSKTFTDLGTHATGWSWVVPWLLISVAAIAFFAVVGQKIGFRKVAENQVAASPKATERMDRLAPDARERAMAQQAKGTQIFTEYLYPLTLLILNLIITAVLFATFTFGAGAKMAFKTAFAVITFAGLPGIVRLGLGIVSILAGTNPDSFSLQNPVATNPGYFLSPAESPFWFGVLSSVDVFLIWTLVLSAIGFTCVSKVKRGTAFAVVFGWWAIFSVGGAAIGAALS